VDARDEDALRTAVQQIPDGSWVSRDGRWLWRDAQWIPMPATPQTGIFWFSSMPRWFPTILILGLIGLIPFVGAMNIYGYAIVTARNLRAGYRVLPPANFSYIGLGAPVVLLSLAWSAISFLLALALGATVAFAAYGQTHSIAWAIALAVPTGFTVLGLANIPSLPLFVPALEMSDREGWAIFRIPSLVRHATQHWRSTWYGAAIFGLWYLMYVAFVLVVGVIPLGSFLAVIVALPVLAPMIAGPVARFNDPPTSFSKGAANALAAVWFAVWILGLAVIWGIGVTAASIVSSHPDETACVFDSQCTFSTSGNLEAVARVRYDAQDATLVTVDVTYINRSASPSLVNPADYSARTATGVDLSPSTDCPLPAGASVAPGARLEQHVCFRLPSADAGFEVHLPWVGWTSRIF
jgi:hypothetical protein